MRAAMIGATALMLAGCGHLPGQKAVPRGGETITYEAIGCVRNKDCPVYSVTLGPDGQGIFTGTSGLAVAVGEHRFQATSIEVANYVRALNHVRPKAETLIVPGKPGCGPAERDWPSTDIRWQSADGSQSHLLVYAGCSSAKAHRLNDMIRGLPVSLLDLQQFLGSD